MTKLICEHCLNENDIKNEHAVFCNKCHKKLSHNFTDWKQQRSVPDFETYINEFQQHNTRALELYNNEKVNEQKTTSKKLFLKFASAVILLVVVFCVSLQNQKNALLNFKPLSDNTHYLNEIHWKNYSFGDSLSITLPFDLKYSPTVINPFLAQYTHAITSKQAESSESFSVTIEEYELSPYFATNHFDFFNVQDRYVIEANAEVIPLNESENIIMKNYSVDVAHNTFYANNNQYLSDNYTLIKNNKGIKIIISYLKDDKLLNKYADIVNESIYKNA